MLGIRTTGDLDSPYSFAYPSLPVNSVSKISFESNWKCPDMYFGVCYADRLKKKDYSADSKQCPNLVKTDNNIGKGFYLMSSDGRIFSNSVVADNNKQTSVRLKEGDTVSVELNPVTGIVRYSIEGGASVEQQTSIRSTIT